MFSVCLKNFYCKRVKQNVLVQSLSRQSSLDSTMVANQLDIVIVSNLVSESEKTNL